MVGIVVVFCYATMYIVELLVLRNEHEVSPNATYLKLLFIWSNRLVVLCMIVNVISHVTSVLLRLRLKSPFEKLKLHTAID